jgi:hypothetical protein
MAAMSQRIAFILGRGAVVSASTTVRPATSQAVVTSPTASSRRSAAQPKTKGLKAPKPAR